MSGSKRDPENYWKIDQLLTRKIIANDLGMHGKQTFKILDPYQTI